MWYQENKPSDGSNYDFTKTLINSGNTERHYVLYQPDVCLPTWSPSGDGNSSRTDGNAVRYKGNLIDNINYKDYEYAKWDGFSVRHGYIINYQDANRDGGAGVRVFRGVELETSSSSTTSTMAVACVVAVCIWTERTVRFRTVIC